MPDRNLALTDQEATELQVFTSDAEPLLLQRDLQDGRDAVTSEDSHASMDSKPLYRSFLIYSAALEAVQLITLSLFMPLALEQYARDNGKLSDHVTPCESTKEGCQTFLFHLFWINTASFSLFITCFSVLLQFIVAVSLGDYVDSAHNRRWLVFRACLAASIAASLFLFISSNSILWPIIALLAICLMLCHSITAICLNALIPIIARSQTVSENGEKVSNERDDLISRAMAHVSARGILIGYIYGLIFLCLSLIPSQIWKGLLGMRLAITASGLQLLVFSIVAVNLERSFFDTIRKENSNGLNLKESWIRLWILVKEASSLKETFKYLIFWLFISDALATISSAALLYAKTSLQMSSASIIGIGVLVPVCSMLSTILFPKIATRFNYSSHSMLVLLVQITAIIPLYSLLGYIPAIREAGGFGSFTTSYEMFGVAILYGLTHGAFNSYSRAVYGELIPSGNEGKFFALYSITSKSTSFIGPLCVGVLSQLTGSLRSGFIVILIGIVGPLPILMSINMHKGREDATAFALQ